MIRRSFKLLFISLDSDLYEPFKAAIVALGTSTDYLCDLWLKIHSVNTVT